MPTFQPYDPRKTAVDSATNATNTSTNTPTGKLSERAMLVDLTIKRYQAAKHDRRVTREVAQTHGNAEHMGKYTKQLLPAEALAEITTLATQIATYHRSRTLPWLDTGSRILSSAAYFDYAAQMRIFKADWEVAVNTFVNSYPAMRQQARVLLNGLFDPNDYPDPNTIAGRFDMQYTVYPFPDSTDFRVQLGTAETALVKQQIEDAANRAMQQATLDIVKRMRDAVGRMAERLTLYRVTENGVENKFHDTLVSNIEDLIQLVPILNITNDPNITALAREMIELIKYDPQTLRDDETVRKNTAEAAQAILDKMADFV